MVLLVPLSSRWQLRFCTADDRLQDGISPTRPVALPGLLCRTSNRPRRVHRKYQANNYSEIQLFG
jgi:hypothetical protein